MGDKSKRNELLTTLADLDELIEDLESERRSKDEVTDITYQLLRCYELKINILKII